MKTNATPKSLDEQEEERLFSPRKFTLGEYFELMGEAAKRRANKSDRHWFDFNDFHHHSPQDVQLHCIYMMLQHIMWKLSDNLHDIEQMAFIETGWDKAFEEADRDFWKLGKSETEDQKADDYLAELEAKIGSMRKNRRSRKEV